MFAVHLQALTFIPVSHNSQSKYNKTSCALVGQNRIYTVNDRIFGDFPAQNTAYTPCLYGYDQP
jgi:hypothetical protein